MSFRFNLEKGVINAFGSISDLIDMAKHPDNYSTKADFRECMFREVSHYTDQKTYDDLFGTQSLEKIKSNLRVNDTAFVNQRKRQRCEYDGDFNLDNKYEIKPFDSSFKKPIVKKIINLEVELGFHSGIKASSITKFCKSIINLIITLETSGYLVQVNATKFNTNASSCSKDLKAVFEIKKPNSYVSQQDLLRVFSGNFYRRVIHSFVCYACEAVGLKASDGLGQPLQSYIDIEYTPNKIRFNSMVKDLDQDKLLKNILEKVTV